jgi:hypothetical protein
MGLFSAQYKSGFLVGIALAGGLSLWLSGRESIYLRVKSDLEKEKH